eukprot:2697286-Rhodomonas_salina.1
MVLPAWCSWTGWGSRCVQSASARAVRCAILTSGLAVRGGVLDARLSAADRVQPPLPAPRRLLLRRAHRSHPLAPPPRPLSLPVANMARAAP